MNRSAQVAAAAAAVVGGLVSGCCSEGNCQSSGPVLDVEVSLDAVMTFEFQPLVDRMVDKYGWSEADAKQGFEDTKRFLYLCGAAMDGQPFAPSEKIDEVWHNFILFTEDYTKFCKDHFGRFIHHRPRRRSDHSSGGRPIQHTLKMARSVFGDLSENWQFKRADGSVVEAADCSPSTNCQDADCHESRIEEPVRQISSIDSLNEVLTYKSPAVVARLAHEEHLALDEAEILFEDTLRFLWLGNQVKFPICPSERIDLGWHIFLLFTQDYRDFCQKHFGGFIDHHPRRPEDKPDGGAMVRMSREYADKVLGSELGLTLSQNWVYSRLEADGKCCGNCGQGCCKR
jgi:hypothetical protein